MANQKYQPRHLAPRRRAGISKKTATLLLSIVLILGMAIGGTVAYLVTDTTPVRNTFTPSRVSCEVTETVTDNVKTEIKVHNTSDISAYIRVKLVTYRVNDARQHIGGTATIPDFTLGDNWVKNGDYYYYTQPVAAGATTTDSLVGQGGLALTSYTDVDGGKQVIEVMAEAIQSEPAKAVLDAWGVDPSKLS